jgi:hypothetical protein
MHLTHSLKAAWFQPSRLCSENPVSAFAFTGLQLVAATARASHNPNNLIALLQHYPWHVDALLALSDIYIYTGEGQQSAEMLERCLFALEGAWHPWWGCTS